MHKVWELAEKAWKTAIRAQQTASGSQGLSLSANSTVNSATVVAAAAITTPATTDLPTQAPGVAAFLVSAGAFVRHSIVDHAMTAQLVEDPAGAATVFGPVISFDSSHGNANGNVSIPPTRRVPPPGAVRKYALLITNGTAGTVTIFAANESEVTVQPLG